MDLKQFRSIDPARFTTCWSAPSNIAFVKYWGKKGHQTPANPSLSMTLRECLTKTTLTLEPGELSVTLKLDGVREEKFEQKIKNYLLSLVDDLPWVTQRAYSIDTGNTFPHGTGIASSASGLAALSLCLVDYLYAAKGLKPDEEFWKRASHLARLGSGSASRSIFGGFASWGASELSGASDEYANPVVVHPSMENLQDTVIVLSDSPKSVSSTHGHGRMREHFFAATRFQQARHHHSEMHDALLHGDLENMGRILENEALSLHAMMLTAPDSYTLLLPGTLSVIELVRDFRHQTGLPLYFTLDAGPNLHLIYPENEKNKISTFIKGEISPLAKSCIFDSRGDGPVRC